MDAVASLDRDGGMTGQRHAVVGLPGLMWAALRLRSAFLGAKTCFLVSWRPFFSRAPLRGGREHTLGRSAAKTCILRGGKTQIWQRTHRRTGRKRQKKMSYSQSIDLDEP